MILRIQITISGTNTEFQVRKCMTMLKIINSQNIYKNYEVSNSRSLVRISLFLCTFFFFNYRKTLIVVSFKTVYCCRQVAAIFSLSPIFYLFSTAYITDSNSFVTCFSYSSETKLTILDYSQGWKIV